MRKGFKYSTQIVPHSKWYDEMPNIDELDKLGKLGLELVQFERISGKLVCLFKKEVELPEPGY